MNPQQYYQNGQGSNVNGPQMFLPGQQPAASAQFNTGRMNNMVAQQNMAAQPNMMSMGNINTQQGSAVVPQGKDVSTSTQAMLLISELRDNMVIMKDGSFRAVVACRSINFDLMSDTEREGIEYSYQNFLNSLKFTTQITRNKEE